MAYRSTPYTEQRKHERRQRILDSARDLIARGGFSAARIRDIAAAAGISEAAVFRYFPTVISLLVEVFDRAAANELEAVREAVCMQGPADVRLGGAVRTHVERAMRRPRLAHALLAEPLAPELERVRLAWRKRFQDLFADVMREAVEMGRYRSFDTRTAAACMIGAMDEALIWPLTISNVEPPVRDEQIDFVVRFCMNAIAPWRIESADGSA